MGADHADHEMRVRLLERARQRRIILESRCARMDYDKLVAACLTDDLFPRYALGRGIEQPCPFDHARRIGEPGRIPERADLPARLVARARTTVKALE